MKTALITGISGQDGSYLANFLLKKKYKIIGLDRRSSRNNDSRLDYFKIKDKIIVEYSDITENASLERVFNKYKIDEVYNLAAQSFVGSSFITPKTTSHVNAIGPLEILEILRNKKKKIKFYQASTSEMYGEVVETPQNEQTPFNPVSPYGTSKLFAYYTVKNYRTAFKMFACNGIMFNHESTLRGEEFVTKKIITSLVKIIKGQQKTLFLGNIYSKRDWGFAGDYVEAMWKIMQQKDPDDYVIATGKQFSIKNFIDEAAKFFKINIIWKNKGIKEIGINKNTKKIIIKIDKKLFRPNEVGNLIGDATKAKKILKWRPKFNFKSLVKNMCEEELKKFL
jgi:GDPmannose 4,6-dehydratase